MNPVEAPGYAAAAAPRDLGQLEHPGRAVAMERAEQVTERRGAEPTGELHNAALSARPRLGQVERWIGRGPLGSGLPQDPPE